MSARRATLFAFACLLAAVIGCGGSSNSGPLDSKQWLELLDSSANKNDPKNQVEISLGEFHVTHSTPLEYELVTVRFTAFAVVPQGKSEEAAKLLETAKQRVRDGVLAIVQRAEYQSLYDPTLVHFKGELTAMINQTIRRNHVRDVVFSSYIVDKG